MKEVEQLANAVTEVTAKTDLLTSQQIAKLLPIFANLKSWMTAVEAQALQMAINGETIEGYKLVEKRTVAKLTNEENLVNDIATYLIPKVDGETEAQTLERLNKFKSLCYMSKLKSSSDLEGLVPTKVWKDLKAKYFIKPKGDPQLVTIGTKGTEWKPETKVIEAFAQAPSTEPAVVADINDIFR